MLYTNSFKEKKIKITKQTYNLIKKINEHIIIFHPMQHLNIKEKIQKIKIKAEDKDKESRKGSINKKDKD